jgi:nucleoside-diphosphate-sugar epimerase
MNSASDMSVIVTGAGGFVCRHIVDALLQAGYRVLAIDQHFDDDLRLRWEQNTALTLIQTNPYDPGSFATVLNSLTAHALIHGAAVTASADEIGMTPEALYRVNVEPLLTTLGWVREKHPHRSIFLSSAAVFRGSEYPQLTESTPLPLTVQGVYAAAKLASETLVRTLREEGFDAISIRLGNIYGTGESARSTRPQLSTVARMVEQALHSGFIEVAEAAAPIDWTYAADVGRACVALLITPTLHHDLYHVVSPQAVALTNIAHAIQTVLGNMEIRLTSTAQTPARGVLISERFAAETEFYQWTAFEDGIGILVNARLQRHQAEVMP